MLHRAYRLAVLIAVAAVAACSGPPPPISVEEGSLVVLNQTRKDWTNVRILLNDYFGASIAVLKAGGRASAPLRQFTTAHGQRWDARAGVRKVEVTADNPDGSPVTLLWESQPAAGR